MKIKHDNICIVGGGSSGWLVASALIRYFPNKNITLIESPNIPNIGVGESTTSMMRGFINHHLKIEDKDFMPGVDGVYKLSVRFEDFSKIGDGGFHYPFGLPVFKIPNSRFETWAIKNYYFPGKYDVRDFARSFVPQITLAELNKISENKNGQFDNLRFHQDYGYHFSAGKLGEFLKEKYAKPKGVKHIVSEIKKVNTGEHGVESLVLDDGTLVSYDVYIDCSGFRSLLLGQAMQEEFISFNHWLPNNSAWATPSPYKEDYIYDQMRPYTNCTALANGWAWHTPIWSRVGNGYSYSDKYISDEDALEQFKEYLVSKKVPGNFSREEVDNFPFFKVKSKSGHYRRSWVKNVIGIGLSAGFLEPLEGTGLLFVTTPILEICKYMQRDVFTQLNIDMFNQLQKYLFTGWRDFLSFFYHLSTRDDSEYWREIIGKTYDIEYLTENDRWMGNFREFYSAFQKDDTGYSLSDQNGIIYVSKGMNASFDLDATVEDRMFALGTSGFSHVAEQIKYIHAKSQADWRSAAEKELHVYDWLKQNYYKEKDNG